jgi:hypothetical protein
MLLVILISFRARDNFKAKPKQNLFISFVKVDNDSNEVFDNSSIIYLFNGC